MTSGHLPDGHLPDGHLPEGHLPEGESDWTPEHRRDFEARWLRRDFYIRSVDVTGDYLFEEVVKDPASGRKVRLRLYALAAIAWCPNEVVSQGEYCRPSKPNGFSYEATSTNGGTTSTREPLWPTVIDEVVRDGSVTWTCRAAGSNGLNAISDPSAVSEPSGLTIGAISVAEETNILATYSGGTEGADYDVAFTWTLDGVQMVGRQKVRVAKQ